MSSDRTPGPGAPSSVHEHSRPREVRGELFHGYLSVQSGGVVALPPALRRRHHLDRPGEHVEMTARADGVLEVRPMVAVPASEVWFWDERWQAGEREVEEHVRAGEVVVADAPEDFLAQLVAFDDQAGVADEA